MSGELLREIERLKEKIKKLELASPSLEMLLKRRGFIIHTKEPEEGLLLPSKEHIDSYYENMKKYSFRIFLRDVIKHAKGFRLRDVSRYATEEVTKQYIDYLVSIGLVQKRDDSFYLASSSVVTFGETLEWFVAETLKREFSMDACWGIKFRGREVGGDYDLLAAFEKGIMYMEIKSSPPRQVYDREVRAFLLRVRDLCPEMAIFLMDTHLRMKDKMVPMFEEELKNIDSQTDKVERLHAEIFSINKRVFITNTKPSVEANISTILSHFLRRRCL